MSAESIITIVLAVIAIMATLFTKPMQKWLLTSIRNISDFFHLRSKNIMFRAFLVFLIHIGGLGLLYALGVIVSLGIIISLIVISVILFVEVYLIYQPIISQLLKLESNFKTLEMRLEILDSAKKIELENIQLRWPEFVKALSDKPVFIGVSAFLQSSKPVYIENDTLLIGVPEIVYDVADAINFDKLTPQYQSFFGNGYKTKITILKSVASK